MITQTQSILKAKKTINRSDLQILMLKLCAMQVFDFQTYFNLMKNLPEGYFSKGYYKCVQPEWLQQYLDLAAEQEIILSYTVLSELAEKYTFSEKIILSKLTLNLPFMNPFSIERTDITELLITHNLFMEHHFWLFFSKSGSYFLSDISFRSVLINLVKKNAVQRDKLVLKLLESPKYTLPKSLQHFFYKMFKVLKTSQEELKGIATRITLPAVLSKKINDILIKNTFSLDHFLDFFVPEAQKFSLSANEIESLLDRIVIPVFENLTKDKITFKP